MGRIPVRPVWALVAVLAVAMTGVLAVEVDVVAEIESHGYDTSTETELVNYSDVSVEEYAGLTLRFVPSWSYDGQYETCEVITPSGRRVSVLDTNVKYPGRELTGVDLTNDDDGSCVIDFTHGVYKENAGTWRVVLSFNEKGDKDEYNSYGNYGSYGSYDSDHHDDYYYRPPTPYYDSSHGDYGSSYNYDSDHDSYNNYGSYGSYGSYDDHHDDYDYSSSSPYYGGDYYSYEEPGTYVQEMREVTVTVVDAEAVEWSYLDVETNQPDGCDERCPRDVYGGAVYVEEDEYGYSEGATLICDVGRPYESCVFSGPEGDFTVVDGVDYLDDGYSVSVVTADKKAGKCAVKVQLAWGEDLAFWQCAVQAEDKGRYLTGSGYFTVARPEPVPVPETLEVVPEELGPEEGIEEILEEAGPVEPLDEIDEAGGEEILPEVVEEPPVLEPPPPAEEVEEELEEAIEENNVP